MHKYLVVGFHQDPARAEVQFVCAPIAANFEELADRESAFDAFGRNQAVVDIASLALCSAITNAATNGQFQHKAGPT
jgi:Tfp pilus assembly PilM family ATPase